MHYFVVSLVTQWLKPQNIHHQTNTVRPLLGLMHLLALLFMVAPIPAHAFSLKNHPFSIEGFEYYVEDVIVAQQEKYMLGLAPGIGYIKLRDSLSTELRQFFTKHLAADGVKKPVILKVNKVLFSGHQLNEAMVELSLSFLKHENNQYEQLYASSAVVYQMKKTPCEGTFCLEDLLLQAFKTCMMQFDAVSKSEQLQPIAVAVSDLHRVMAYKSFWSVFQQSSTTPGWYYSYNDFIQQRIDPTPKIEVSKADDLGFRRVRRSGKSQNDFWGYFDGEFSYFLDDNGLHRLRFDTIDSLFYIQVYVPVGFIPVGFDPVGMAIGIAASAVIELTSDRNLFFAFDALTGNLYYRKPNGSELVITSEKGAKKEPICIYYFDSLVACIYQTEYVKLKLPSEHGVGKFTFSNSAYSREFYIRPNEYDLFNIEYHNGLIYYKNRIVVELKKKTAVPAQIQPVQIN
ncbi:MAG: hypothetical protein ACK417_06340 [Bacteroidia bacterium]